MTDENGGIVFGCLPQPIRVFLDQDGLYASAQKKTGAVEPLASQHVAKNMSPSGPSDRSSSELRESARQARALAEHLTAPEAKWGFVQLAEKWEAQALAIERAADTPQAPSSGPSAIP